MTKIFLFLLLSFNGTTAPAQTNKQYDTPSIKQIDTSVTYRLFPTQNIWTFIKLNTRNGKMWQIQFGMSRDKRFITNLSSEALVATHLETDGRFTLYPTQNIYTFILIDQIDGRTWQVQWSTDSENKRVTAIE